MQIYDRQIMFFHENNSIRYTTMLYIEQLYIYKYSYFSIDEDILIFAFIRIIFCSIFSIAIIAIIFASNYYYLYSYDIIFNYNTTDINYYNTIFSVIT